MDIENFALIDRCELCRRLKGEHDESAKMFRVAKGEFDSALTGQDQQAVVRAGEELQRLMIERHLAEITIIRHLQDHVAPI